MALGALEVLFTGKTDGFDQAAKKVKKGIKSVDDQAKGADGLKQWAQKGIKAAKYLAGPAALGGVAIAFDKISANVQTAGKNAADFFNEISFETRQVLLPALEAITAEQMAQQAAAANMSASLSGVAIRWEQIKTHVAEALGSTVDLEAAQRDAIDAMIDYDKISEQAYKNVEKRLGPASQFGLFDRTFAKALATENAKLREQELKTATDAANAQVKAYETIQNASYDRQLLSFQRHQMDRQQYALERINIQIREVEAQQTLAFGEQNKARIGQILEALKQQRNIMKAETSTTAQAASAVWDKEYTGPGSNAWIQKNADQSAELSRMMQEKEFERIQFANTLADEEWRGYGSTAWNERIIRENENLQNALAEQDEAKQQARLDMTATMFGNLAALTQAGSKKLFNIGKVAAIAEATVSAYNGISKTLGAYPYPWNIPMAAAHAVQAFAQIRAIASTNYGSTSAGGGIVGGAGGNAAAPITTPAIPAASIQIVGSEGATFSRDQVVGLIGQLNEAIGDGAQLSVAT